MMSGAPVPVEVFGHHVFNIHVFEIEDSQELDFLLIDPADLNAVSSNSGGGVNAGSGSGRDRFVDYTWLDHTDRPIHNSSDTFEKRVEALVGWVGRCHIKKCTRELPDVLNVYSQQLSFDYDSYLSTIKGVDGRCVEGFFYSSGSQVYITLSIPLLLNQGDEIRGKLSTIVKLYGKLLQSDPVPDPTFSHADFSLLLTFAADASSGRSSSSRAIKLTSENLEFHLEEKNAPQDSIVTDFIRRCVSIADLPRYAPEPVHRSASVSSRFGSQFSLRTEGKLTNAHLIDFIPSLEHAILQRVTHPEYFLQLVDHVTRFFGQPVSLIVGANDTNGQNSVIVHTAAFDTVDECTQFGFCVSMRFGSARMLPVVNVIANQYTSSGAPERVLQLEAKYPEWLSDHNDQLKKEGKVSGFMSVDDVGDVIHEMCIEAMSNIISQCA
ncbi:hypothetical protein ERJ75_001393800 [Trypanosoma vivax]|uniref:Uncharacterized protein n=1 Tax=Trypanosoma vivax (strain Y486) TaxID=1055687 RepID=G0TYV1_TRYVY|nr:hypothetical protein ERJ75_001393800 [Trypanosoma vivax]CCC49152.1 conserved hypothetical protein [Trypanosoma vivax Y486]